jgi:O-antigen ligase
LLMSRSATALVVSIAVLVVQGLIAQIASGRRAGRQGVTFLVLITALALTVVLLGLRGRLFGVLGKTSDLTGRDEIWAGTWGAAQEHLMFGHGFGVFWSEDSLQRAELRRVVGWDVAGPHQGVLEIVTDFGLVGLALFVALVIIVGSRVVDRVSAGSLAKSHVVCAGLIVAIVLSSVTEATLLAPGLPILALTSGLLLNDQIAERIAADRRLPTTSRTTTVGAI